METISEPVEVLAETTQQEPKPLAETCQAGIRVKGRNVVVPSRVIRGRTVISAGKWLKKAVLKDEDLLEGEPVADPGAFVAELKRSGLKADLVTFAQKIPESQPIHSFRFEWDNVAVIPISNYADWWEKRVDPGVRRAVRKATKSGVVVRVAEFNDEFVRGIVNINNETPFRQGKPFWHYQKDFESVKAENSTYAERNIFIGAYWQDELIGYIRMTTVDSVGSIIQVLSMIRHYDKRPANALIAKAVEVCAERGLSHLMYCNYVYNDPNSSLTEFKRRNGFEKLLLPRYYIPLTLKGKIALALGLHQGLAKALPQSLTLRLLKLRNSWYSRRARGAEQSESAQGQDRES